MGDRLTALQLLGRSGTLPSEAEWFWRKDIQVVRASVGGGHALAVVFHRYVTLPSSNVPDPGLLRISHSSAQATSITDDQNLLFTINSSSRPLATSSSYTQINKRNMQQHLHTGVSQTNEGPSMDDHAGASPFFFLKQGSKPPSAIIGHLELRISCFTLSSDLYASRSDVNKAVHSSAYPLPLVTNKCASQLLLDSSSETQTIKRNVRQCLDTGLLQTPGQPSTVTAATSYYKPFGILNQPSYSSFKS